MLIFHTAAGEMIFKGAFHFLKECVPKNIVRSEVVSYGVWNLDQSEVRHQNLKRVTWEELELIRNADDREHHLMLRLWKQFEALLLSRNPVLPKVKDLTEEVLDDLSIKFLEEFCGAPILVLHKGKAYMTEGRNFVVFIKEPNAVCADWFVGVAEGFPSRTVCVEFENLKLRPPVESKR